jgi:hypothetical protein
VAIKVVSLMRDIRSLIPGSIRDKWRGNEHRYKKIFWRWNYPVVFLIYFFLPEPVLILYLALCSVYANDESSAGAEEAKEAQK